MTKRALTLAENHDIWRRTNPAHYLKADTERCRILLELIEVCGLVDPSILEVGCNAGRNLEYLRRVGYEKLTGIEICKPAIDLMRKRYPALCETAIVYGSPVERWIGDRATGEFNIVFSMAVLQHIHPASEWVFEHIARITKHNLITIENEAHATEKSGKGKIAGLWTARNYRTIFEAHGLRQMAQRSMGAVCDNNAGMAPYTARIFTT